MLGSFSIKAQTGAVVVSKFAQFRTQPTKTSKIIFTVKKGAKFKLESDEGKNGWYYVSILNGNQKGWIEGENIKFVENDNQYPKKRNSLKDEWVYLYTTKYGDVKVADVYINPAKIQDLGDERTFWIKSFILDVEAYWKQLVESLDLQPIPKDTPSTGKRRNGYDLKYSLTFYKANCGMMTLGAQSVYDYKINDQLFYGEPVYLNDPLRPAIPDSNGEFFLRKACGYRIR